MRLLACALVVVLGIPALVDAQVPPVFEISNPVCRTSPTRTGTFVQVWLAAQLLDSVPRGHVTGVVHLWFRDTDDRRRYLGSVRNELFVLDPNRNALAPVHANNPDLDIQPGEYAGFVQDKFFFWSDVEEVRCGRLAFYHQGRKLPVNINTDWKLSLDADVALQR